MNNQDLEHIQQVIGYRFQNTDLLQQAFVRRSYSAENGGEDNEVLEFIGDKVLDLIVVKLLAEKYGYMLRDLEDFDADEEFNEFACHKDESELTEIKRQLVQRTNLARRIDALGVAEYLILGKGDHSQREASVKEDLFEAILGAAAIDSKWNMEKLQLLAEQMLEPESVLGEEKDTYIAAIQKWTAAKGIGKPIVQFEANLIWGASSGESGMRCVSNPWEAIGTPGYRCLLTISEHYLPFRGYGRSRSEARYDACKKAYQYLEKHDHLFTIRDEIPDPSREEAVSQLEILARRGYFSIPEYDFFQGYNANGNAVWRCVCRIKEKQNTCEATASSKKEAKKEVAWDMLQRVLSYRV